MGIVNKEQALYLAVGAAAGNQTGTNGALNLQVGFENSEDNKAFLALMAQYQSFLDQVKTMTGNLNREIQTLQAKTLQAETEEEKQRLRASVGMLEVMRDQSIPLITDGFSQSSKNWGQLLEQAGTLTANGMDVIVNRLLGQLDELKKSGQLTLESYNALAGKLSSKDKNESDKTQSYFETFGEKFVKIFESMGKTTEMSKKEWGDFGKSATKVFSDLSAGMAGIKDIGAAIGWDAETQAIFSQVSSVLSGAGTLAAGLESGNVTQMITGGTKLIASAINLFDFNTKRADKRIKEHAKNIKALEVEYSNLSWEIQKALGEDYYKQQIKQAQNKEDQIAEIQGQIEAEQSKRRKKRDNDKIQEYENQIQKLKHDIIDIQQKVVDDLMTTNVKSFAANIASALIDGMSNGMDGLGKVVDDKMKQLMKDVLKKQIEVNVVQVAMKPMFDLAGEYFSAGSDKGFGLSSKEMEGLIAAGNEGKEKILAGLEGYEKMLEQLDLKDKVTTTCGVTGELQAAMTEGTASQLVGLWNMTAVDIRSMLNLTYEQVSLCLSMNLNVNEVLRQQYLIEYNTRRTAENSSETLEEVKAGFTRLDNRLQKIDTNTQGYTGRGK